jgi:Fe2+ transport system protein FeoA
MQTHTETRRIKVESFQYDYNTPSKSLLRIKGRWLTALGFTPGSSVELTAVSPGVLEIRLCTPSQLRSEDFTNLIDRLTVATVKAADGLTLNGGAI